MDSTNSFNFGVNDSILVKKKSSNLTLALVYQYQHHQQEHPEAARLKHDINFPNSKGSRS